MSFTPFESLLAARGYAVEDLIVNLNPLSPTNQVLMIYHIKYDSWLNVPVEEDVTTWTFDKLASVIADCLDDYEEHLADQQP